MTIRSISMAGLVVASAIALAGCPDPAGQFDDFSERTADMRITTTGPVCTERIDISGSYFMGVGIFLQPSTPILINTDITIDTSSEPWGVDMDLTMLDFTTRQPVTDAAACGGVCVSSGTGEIDADGLFTINFEGVVMPAPANPVTGSTLNANLTLLGCASDTALSCGNVEGLVTSVGVDLAGSTFAFVPGAGSDANGTVVSACPE